MGYLKRFPSKYYILLIVKVYYYGEALARYNTAKAYLLSTVYSGERYQAT